MFAPAASVASLVANELNYEIPNAGRSTTSTSTRSAGGSSSAVPQQKLSHETSGTSTKPWNVSVKKLKEAVKPYPMLEIAFHAVFEEAGRESHEQEENKKRRWKKQTEKEMEKEREN